MVKIEVDKSYRTRDGRKAKCYSIASGVADLHTETGIVYVWADGGLRCRWQTNPCDIISEWQDDEPRSPVHERVIREIVPGTYGKLKIECYKTSAVSEYAVYTPASSKDPKDFRDMAKMLLDIADVLEENGG